MFLLNELGIWDEVTCLRRQVCLLTAEEGAVGTLRRNVETVTIRVPLPWSSVGQWMGPREPVALSLSVARPACVFSCAGHVCSFSIAFFTGRLMFLFTYHCAPPFHFSFCLFLVLFFVFFLSHPTLVHASRSVYSCIHLCLHSPGGTQVVDRKPAFLHTKETHCPFNPSTSHIDMPRATH